MATLGELVVKMSANTAALEKGFKSAQDQTARLGGSMGTILKAGAVAAAAGIGIAVAAGMTFLKAAAEEQASIARLAAAVTAAGVSWEEHGAAIQAVITEREKLAFSDDELRSSLSILTAITGNVTEALDRQTIAMDFARGANIDLETASKLLAKVTNENVNVLGRYGIRVKEGADATEVLGLVQQKFSGQSAAYAETAAGKWELMTNQIENVKEALGTALLPVATRVFGAIGEFLTDHLDDIERFSQAVVDLAEKGFKRAEEFLLPLIDAFREWWSVHGPKILDSLKQTGEFLREHKELVYAVIAAWATLEGMEIAGHLITIAQSITVANMSLSARAGLIGSLMLLGYAAGSLAASEWPGAWGRIVEVTEGAVNGIIKSINRIIDGLNWILDQIRKIPFAESFIGHIPKLEQVSWEMAEAVREPMLTRLEQLKAELAQAGADAGAAYAINFGYTLAANMRAQADIMASLYQEATGGPPVGPIMPGYEKQIEALAPLRKAMNQLWDTADQLEAHMGDVTESIKNAAKAAQSSTPPVVDFGAGLGGAGDAAGEAFRGLDADLAALRESMRTTAEQGLVVLTAAITNETDELGALEQALDGVNGFIDAAGEHINDLQEDIAANTAELQGWQSAALEGTRAFSDASQAIQEDSDKLALAMAKVNLGVLTEGLEEGDYASIGLSAKVKALAKLIGIDLHGAGKLTFEKIQEVIKTAGDQMAIFSAKASTVNLQEKVTLGPKQYDLQKFFEDLGGYAEFSFDQIIAGASLSDAAIKSLSDQLVTWNDAQVNAADLAKLLEGKITDQKKVVEDLQGAFDTLTKDLATGGAIDDAIKSIWSTREGPTVVKSIEEAFAAIDRGDQAAAEAAMASALSLWDEIKKLVPGAETGIFAPLEKVLKDVETSVDVDISGMTKTLSGNLGGVSKELVGVQEAVAGGFVAMMSNLRDWIVTLLSHIAGQVNFLSLLVDIRDILNNISGSLGAAAISGAGGAMGVPALAGGGYINRSGLAYVHAGESVVPARSGGTTNIYLNVKGSILSERDLESVIADAMRRGRFRGL